MATVTPLRPAVAFLTAALISACGGGSPTPSSPQTPEQDSVGKVESPQGTVATGATGTGQAQYPPVEANSPNPPPPGSCPEGLSVQQTGIAARLQSSLIAASGSEGFTPPTAAEVTSFSAAFAAFVAAPS